MSVRKIVQIDEEKCDGCGLCVPECVEGAIQIIDGKARVVSDTYCDGLGACLGHCPQDAIKIIEREAEDFSEEAAMAHAHKTDEEHQCQCPSSKPQILQQQSQSTINYQPSSNLTNWPIQITLAPVNAPYFKDAHLLIAADCAPFAYANFHQLLKDKVLLIGCPKLDNAEFYTEKLGSIIKGNNIQSVTVAHMEVPCCFGLKALVEKALAASGKNIEMKTQVFGIHGEEK